MNVIIDLFTRFFAAILIVSFLCWILVFSYLLIQAIVRGLRRGKLLVQDKEFPISGYARIGKKHYTLKEVEIFYSDISEFKCLFFFA